MDHPLKPCDPPAHKAILYRYVSRKAGDSFLLLGLFSNLGLSKTRRKAVGNRWGLAWPSIGNHRQYNQRNCRSWRLQSSRGTKTTVSMLEVMDCDTIRLWLAYYVTVLTFGDVSWYECSEWFWWYLVCIEPKHILIAVFMWQDHCYLMRRKELATELEQQGITASRMTALEIQDFMSFAMLTHFSSENFYKTLPYTYYIYTLC